MPLVVFELAAQSVTLDVEPAEMPMPVLLLAVQARTTPPVATRIPLCPFPSARELWTLPALPVVIPAPPLSVVTQFSTIPPNALIPWPLLVSQSQPRTCESVPTEIPVPVLPSATVSVTITLLLVPIPPWPQDSTRQ